MMKTTLTLFAITALAVRSGCERELGEGGRGEDWRVRERDREVQAVAADDQRDDRRGDDPLRPMGRQGHGVRDRPTASRDAKQRQEY
jgi:hypothetical protein